MEQAKKLQEEGEALGKSPGDDGIVKTDMRFNYIRMDVPEWICESICAGLDMDELASGEADIEEPEDFNEVMESNLFKTEEE